MRKLVYGLLTSDAIFGGLVADANVYEQGAIDDRPNALTWVVLRFSGPTTTPGRAKQLRLDVDAYQDRGDYSLIDAILARARVILLAAQQIPRTRAAEEGGGVVWLVQADDEGDGPDNYDPEWAAATRSSGYVLTCSGL